MATVWRDLPAYRLITYCFLGFDAGINAGKQIGIADLKHMGAELCRVMLDVFERQA